jgi:teichuronic acid biosynthesis glycosyltransferase TuaC
MPTILRQCIALASRCELRVWATIPWFPGASLLRHFRHSIENVSKIPHVDSIFGLEVNHPRTFYLPRMASLSAACYAISIARELTRCRTQVDVILATFAYPDGVAAIALGQLLGIPTVVQVIGTDIDVVAKLGTVLPQVRLAFPRAAGVIAVSSALANQCESLGVRPENTQVIVTGVDREAFAPRNRQAARALQGLPANCKVILYVGRLSEHKGALDALRAFDDLRIQEDIRLVFIGDGPLLEHLRERAAHRSNVIVKGSLDGKEVSNWLAASDLLTLPSYHEGTPNVILEALSSGRPVVATRIGGIPDVCSSAAYGELVSPGAIQELTQAYERVLSRTYVPEEIAACPSLYGWDENARRVLDFLDRARRSGVVGVQSASR